MGGRSGRWAGGKVSQGGGDMGVGHALWLEVTAGSMSSKHTSTHIWQLATPGNLHDWGHPSHPGPHTPSLTVTWSRKRGAM